MANRPTRNKIRWHLKAASQAFDKVLGHFQSADELSEDRSSLLNEVIPVLTGAILEFKAALEKLRSEV